MLFGFVSLIGAECEERRRVSAAAVTTTAADDDDDADPVFSTSAAISRRRFCSSVISGRHLYAWFTQRDTTHVLSSDRGRRGAGLFRDRDQRCAVYLYR